jgi:hypothetical protein
VNIFQKQRTSGSGSLNKSRIKNNHWFWGFEKGQRTGGSLERTEQKDQWFRVGSSTNYLRTVVLDENPEPILVKT